MREKKGYKGTDRERERHKGRIIWVYREGEKSIYIFGNLKKENNNHRKYVGQRIKENNKNVIKVFYSVIGID